MKKKRVTLNKKEKMEIALPQLDRYAPYRQMTLSLYLQEDGTLLVQTVYVGSRIKFVSDEMGVILRPEFQ